MNIPNVLSGIRIALVPVFVYLYTSGRVAGAMAVLLAAGLTDVLDGAIARRFHMVTELGKALDPVADKLIQAAMMLCAVRRFPLVWLLFGLHLLREGILAFVGLYVIKSTGSVYSANWYGKLCTAVIYPVMISILAFPQLPEQIGRFGVLLCSALVLMCLVMYLSDYAAILKCYNKKPLSERADRGEDHTEI